VWVLPVCSITQLADAITNLLGGTCKLFTTPCISHELKSLGADTAAAAAASRRQQLHKCEHDPCKLPAECLLEQVGASSRAVVQSPSSMSVMVPVS
jgi:U3 small nucleolar RNA-associated protein 23